MHQLLFLAEGCGNSNRGISGPGARRSAMNRIGKRSSSIRWPDHDPQWITNWSVGVPVQAQLAAMRPIGQCGRPICGKGPAHHTAAESIQRHVQFELQALDRTPKRGDVPCSTLVRSLGRQRRLRAGRIFCADPCARVSPCFHQGYDTWCASGTGSSPQPGARPRPGV